MRYLQPFSIIYVDHLRVEKYKTIWIEHEIFSPTLSFLKALRYTKIEER